MIPLFNCLSYRFVKEQRLALQNIIGFSVASVIGEHFSRGHAARFSFYGGGGNSLGKAAVLLINLALFDLLREEDAVRLHLVIGFVILELYERDDDSVNIRDKAYPVVRINRAPVLKNLHRVAESPV